MPDSNKVRAFLSHKYEAPTVNQFFYELLTEGAYEVQFDVDEGKVEGKKLPTNVTRLERPCVMGAGSVGDDVDPPLAGVAGLQLLERRNGHIVATRMHHRHLLALKIHLAGDRCIVQACFLKNGKAVHIGPDQQRRPVAILHDTDKPGLANIAGDDISQRRHFPGHAIRRPCLLHRQLGIGMQVLEQLFEICIIRRHRVLQRRCQNNSAERGTKCGDDGR